MNQNCNLNYTFPDSSFLERRIFFSLFPLFPALLIGLTFLMTGCDKDDNSIPMPEFGTVKDLEGNTYKTVKIGNQWWMAENLKVTMFNSGENIPMIVNPSEWATTTQPGYSVYNNTAEGIGLLYNLHVISSGNIAPPGWRVPTDEDWKVLEEYLGLPADQLDETNWRGTTEGDQLKEVTTNTTGWIIYDNREVWGTNSTGFNAIGGSCRVFNGEWGVPGLRHSGYWWSSTVINGYGWFRSLDYKKSGIFRYAAQPNYGFSIRCVQE